MNYALERIDKMVMTNLNPLNRSNLDITTNEIITLQAFVLAEYQIICNQLKAESFSIGNENHLTLYVQRYQLGIIHLADIISNYSLTTECKSIKTLYDTILNLLESLLTFIKTYFVKYFDLDLNIPECYKAIISNGFLGDLVSFKKFAKKISLNLILVEIILTPFQVYVTGKPSCKITFRKQIYDKNILIELSDIIKTKEQRCNQEDIVGLLQYLNFNNLRFFSFLTENIKTNVFSLPTIAIQIEQLYWHNKELNQMQVKPQAALYPNLPCLKTMCLSWLQEEIVFIERKVVPALQNVQVNGLLKKQIELSLSVSQIAFALRVMADLKIIKGQNFREITQEISKQSKTGNTDKISAESLRIKSVNPDKGSVNVVKETLINMINHINTNFKFHG